MPARLIHRFGTSDRLFQGAATGSVAALQWDGAVLFGLTRTSSQAQAIRDASWFTGLPQPATRCLDLGDGEGDAGSIASSIVRQGGRPCLLGGSLESGAAILLAAQAEPTVTILLSARLDLDPATVGPGPKLAIGTHDLLPARTVARWHEAGGKVVPATGTTTLAERLAAAIQTLAKMERAVILLDLCVLDTGHAAGTDGVNVGGLTPRELFDTMRMVCGAFDVRAVAAVNLAPDRDPRGHAELAAAEALGLALARHSARTPQ